MSQKQEIWAIIREVYGMSSSTPTSDKQVEVLDMLERYMKGIYKPVIKQDVVVEEDKIETPKVMVTQADGTQKLRGRGRPKKL